MTEQLVSFDTAKLAKEKQFDLQTFNCFDDNGISMEFPRVSINAKNSFCTRPSQSLLQKWLREVHKIHIVIGLDENGYALTLEEDCDDLEDREVTKFKYYSVYNTYELALEAGLIEGLKLIK